LTLTSCPETIKNKIQLPFENTVLYGDTYQEGCNTLVLHGAGQSSRQKFSRLRKSLNSHGLPSASFDFIGHGETGGQLPGSSLRQRTDQATSFIHHACAKPLNLIAASMGAYTAIKLTRIFSVQNLVLLVPAVYTYRAYDLSFGDEFSAAIRVPESWNNSDAFEILSGFKGNILVIAAQNDIVIPDGVIEKILSSGKNAKSCSLHVVPNSEHRALFPKQEDFSLAMEMMAKLCLNEN
jgi:pimeloyl-ACP methyl ester carboxylesterase